MNVLPALQTAAALIAGLGTMMLGVSEDNYLLAALAVVISAASLFLCDRTGWIQFGPWASNVASIVALLVAVARYQMLPQEARILAVADLMGYLQFILQFRRKTTRNFWLLAVVSFLQVSVAAALHSGVTFALMLTVYLFCAITFLALFYLYREQLSFTESTRAAETKSERRGYGFFARLRDDAAPPAMRGELSRRVATIGLSTIVMAVFFFVAVPRIGQTNWVPSSMVGPRTVGFSSEINLGRSGEIIEDPEVVMSVRFTDAESEAPYQVDGEPYFRGTSLVHYAKGRWSESTRTRGAPLPPPPSSELAGMVRLEAAIEPLSTPTLFACAPWFSDDPGERLSTAPGPIQLLRSESVRSVRFSYDVLTTAFRDHRQLNVQPLMHPLRRVDALLELPRPVENVDPIAGLKAVAAGVVAGVPPGDIVGRAQRLESFLRDEGRFQYTMQSPKRPEGTDPLEDFITNNPRGHCEYFAGALALMLRSVGIPARVVVGYRGGDFNVVGSFYQVRQLHAHSWVEAYLPPNNLTATDKAKFTFPQLREWAEENGAWLRLDPTTSNELVLANQAPSRWREVQEVADYVKFLWNNYVVAMDSEQQQQTIYEPASQFVREWSTKLTSRETWRGWLEGMIRNFHPGEWISNGAGELAGQAAVILLVVGALVVAFVLARRRRKGRSPVASAAAAAVRRTAPPVDFYVRLEQVLAGRQLKRTAEQTQREFVQSACGELAETAATRGVSNLPRRIVEAFYRVRFGGRSLDDVERREIDDALNALSIALTPPPPTGASPSNASG